MGAMWISRSYGHAVLTGIIADFTASEIMRQAALVMIGPNKVPYCVHKSLLCYYPQFFRGALEGKFEEGEKQGVWLDTEDEATFNLFLHWMYSGDIVLPRTPKER